MSQDKIKKEFNPHLIRTKIINQTKWSAFVTWGIDLQEYGETQRNAVYFLLHRHMKYLGINESQLSEIMNHIGL